MSILIEPAAHADLDAIEQLYNDATDALETGINYPGWKKGIYPIREDAAESINDNSLFVARNDKDIIGSIILNHHPEENYNSVKWQYDGDYRDVLVVHTLVIHPAFTKLGIGRQLMGFANSFGLQNGIKSIRLDVYENNAPAIKLYESCGYQYVAKIDLGLSRSGLDWFRLYEKLL